MKLAQRTKRKLIIIVATFCIGVGTMNFVGNKYDIAILSSVSDVVTYPFQKTISFLSNQLVGVSKYFNDLETLRVENEKLVAENEKLLYENTILEQYKIENNQLKSLLEIEQRFEEYPSMGAGVIGKDPGNWYKVFTIDKGLVDGVRKSDVVLANGGLVGHVIEANPLSSQVLAIIDDRSSVSAKVVRTGDVGIVRGDIQLTDGSVKMEIDIASEVVKGDQIITSHLSDVYPPGIPIGIVDDVVRGANGLVQYAYITPYVDFKHLENVLVISKGSEPNENNSN